MYMCVYVYIYIYIKREREKERDIPISIHMHYIYNTTRLHVEWHVLNTYYIDMGILITARSHSIT